MASVSFNGGKLHGSGEVCAQFRHAEREERMKHDHSNEDIDRDATPGNWSIRGLSYPDMQARYTARVAEVDKTASNHRKDRVTCVCAVVPVPEGMTDEQAHDWYNAIWDVFSRRYGQDNLIDACVHVDEKHDYIDPDSKETRTSRTHAHFYFVPERDGNLDAKHIITRGEMRSLNREIDTLSRELYGLRFMDGTQAKSRGSVEALKRASEAFELERRVEHARGEKKALSADLTALKGEVSELDGALEQAREAAQARQPRKRLFRKPVVEVPPDEWKAVTGRAQLNSSLGTLEAQDDAIKLYQYAKDARAQASKELDQAKAQAREIVESARDEARHERESLFSETSQKLLELETRARNAEAKVDKLERFMDKYTINGHTLLDEFREQNRSRGRSR